MARLKTNQAIRIGYSATLNYKDHFSRFQEMLVINLKNQQLIPKRVQETTTKGRNTFDSVINEDVLGRKRKANSGKDGASKIQRSSTSLKSNDLDIHDFLNGVDWSPLNHEVDGDIQMNEWLSQTNIG